MRSTLKRIKRTRCLLVAAPLCAVAPTASSDYFFDQYLTDSTPPIRTNHFAFDEGTSTNPLTLGPCLFPPGTGGGVVGGLNNGDILPPGCLSSTPIFSVANHFSANPDIFGRYWVLTMQNEIPWSDTRNPGPGLQSIARSWPGEGTMGFSAISGSLVGESFARMHLVLNNRDFSNPLGGGAVPFLSVGAAENRGNGFSVGALNDATRPSRVAFTSRLWAVGPGTLQNWVVGHYVYATAEWGGIQRWLLLHLYKDSDGGFYEWTVPGVRSGIFKRWNWQPQEGMFYPGAELAYIDAEDTAAVCGFSTPYFTAAGQEISFELDLQALYRCASDLGLFSTAMPSSVVPITGVHWANEVGSDSAIWTSVHGMAMKLSGAGKQSGAGLAEVAARPGLAGPEVQRIWSAWKAACEERLACRESNDGYLSFGASPPVRPNLPGAIVATAAEYVARRR